VGIVTASAGEPGFVLDEIRAFCQHVAALEAPAGDAAIDLVRECEPEIDSGKERP
jgi:hypothetical protein